MPKIAYIIPLHIKDDKVFKAIESIPDGDVSVVVAIPNSLKSWLNKGLDKLETKVKVSFVRTDEPPTYPTLVNLALADEEVQNADLINILEYDDSILPNAHKVVAEYYEDWKDEVEIFSPLACVVTEDEAHDKPVLVGIGNEAPMAPGVAEQFGYVDFNMMLRTNFMFVNGCYIKPSVFEDYGLFKKNFEVFYDYEWALRVVYNGCIVRSIPKATHFHALNPGGAFETQKALPKQERENWLGAARREYFFEDDREISFE